MYKFKFIPPKSWIEKENLYQEIKVSLNNNPDDYKIVEENDRYRVSEVVLVAIVGATGSALVAFIKGLIGLKKSHLSRKIVIQKGDMKIEIPASEDPQKIKKIINTIRNIKANEIDILTD